MNETVTDASLKSEVRRVVLRRAAKALAFQMKTITIDEALLVLHRLRLEAKGDHIATSDHLEFRLGHGDGPPGNLLRALIVARILEVHELGGWRVLIAEET